jgi:hypothetical protein
VAKEYKAEVIHLGPLATDQEIKQFAALIKKRNSAQMVLDRAASDRQAETAENRLEEIEGDFKRLSDGEEDRLTDLEGAFGKVTFVTTDDMRLPRKLSSKHKIISGGLELSRHLFLSPVPPRGMKATGGGIAPASVAYLTELGKSWIVAHPIPEVQCFPKPGLNEAYNYFTVGSLRHSAIPTHTKNQFQFAHMPCAVLVVIDKDNEEFHPTQLHIDYLSVDRNKLPVVLHDGLLFDPTGSKPVSEDDRATLGTDYHARYQHPGVVAAHRALNTLFRPATLIDGGDMGEFGSVSHWLENKPGDSEGLRLKDDLLAVRRLMDALDNVSSIKRKVLIDSNHHEWLTDFVSKNAALKGLVDWATLARDMFGDWDVILREAGENKIFKFGDLLIRHGDKDGGVKGKFKNIKYLCGHFHKFVAYRRSVGLGCGAKLGPKYTGNDVNAWQSQIASLTKHQGVTAVAPKIILHDKTREVSRFSFGGSIYEVDFYHNVEQKGISDASGQTVDKKAARREYMRAYMARKRANIKKLIDGPKAAC